MRLLLKLRDRLARTISDFLLWLATFLALPSDAGLDRAIISGVLLALLTALTLLVFLVHSGI